MHNKAHWWFQPQLFFFGGTDESSSNQIRIFPTLYQENTDATLLWGVDPCSGGNFWAVYVVLLAVDPRNISLRNTQAAKHLYMLPPAFWRVYSISSSHFW
jgi:hypothetical protein